MSRCHRIAVSASSWPAFELAKILGGVGVASASWSPKVPDYVLTWVDVAREQYAALPPDTQHLINLGLAELLDEPDGPGCSEDPTTGQWVTSDHVGRGLLLYTFRPGAPRLVILRLCSKAGPALRLRLPESRAVPG